jgi:tetratricopeptide (TPR) repeat protein
LLLGQAYVGSREFDKAVSLLARMNEEFPGNTEVLINLALGYVGIQETEKAERILDEILTLQPGLNRAVLMLLGLRYRSNLNGATAFVQQQIDKAPDTSDLQLLLADIYERQARYDESLAALKRADELSPGNTRVVLATAGLLKTMGRTEEAMSRFQALIDQDPSSLPGHLGMAALLQADSRAEEAEKIYRKVLELQPDQVTAANNLAFLLANKPGGDLGEALRLAMVAKQARPDDPYISDTLGWVHYQRKNYALAIPQFEQAFVALPNEPMIGYHLALAYADNGQIDKAIEVLKEITSTEPDFPLLQEAQTLLNDLQKKGAHSS